MKTLPLIFLFIVPSALSFGQIQPDSIAHKVISASEKINIDSLEQQLHTPPDTLRAALQKADSIRQRFNRAADSIQSTYQQAVSTLDAQTNALSNTVDSLQHLNIPTPKYTRALDSLNDLRRNIDAKLNARLDSLKANTIGKLNALDLPPQYSKPIQELSGKIEGLNLSSNTVKIPALDIPGYALPEVKGLDNIASKAGNITNRSGLDKLPQLETPGVDAGQLGEQAKTYQQEIKNLTQGQFDKFTDQSIDKLADESLNNLTDQHLDELADQPLDKLTNQPLDKLADPKAAKEQATALAKKAAVNHFAGKEEQLKAAMEKISKYKQKYSSVSSIKNLPKRRPNPMKGKPFIERLVPGLYLQYQQKNDYLLDVNPYLGYILTGRFTTGIGWNHRYAYDRNTRAFNSRARIFGPRGYVDFKLGKGFIAHVEGEAMNTFVPSTLHGNPDTGNREWVWSVMTGIKKEYTIYKHLKGTALIQYNLFNRYYKAPYIDRLNARIGFEYSLKKAKKKKAKTGKP